MLPASLQVASSEPRRQRRYRRHLWLRSRTRSGTASAIRSRSEGYRREVAARLALDRDPGTGAAVRPVERPRAGGFQSAIRPRSARAGEYPFPVESGVVLLGLGQAAAVGGALSSDVPASSLGCCDRKASWWFAGPIVEGVVPALASAMVNAAHGEASQKYRRKARRHASREAIELPDDQLRPNSKMRLPARLRTCLPKNFFCSWRLSGAKSNFIQTVAQSL